MRKPCVLAVFAGVSALLISAPSGLAAPLELTWRGERPKGGEWVADGTAVSPDASGAAVLERRGAFHQRYSIALDWDPSTTPCIEVDALTATTPWRLTAQHGAGPEILVGDSQLAGVCRRDLAGRLGVQDADRLTLRIYMWGWGTTPRQYLRCRVALLPACPETDADVLLGDMAAGDIRMGSLAEKVRCRVDGHPRLRFNDTTRAKWRQRFATTHADFCHPVSDILADLDALKAVDGWELTPAAYRENRPAWGNALLSIRPPSPPDLRPGEGRDPFPGKWRDLCWHDYSHWVIGACISDDPVFVEQAKRFAVVPTRWRFWLAPDYRYFDFEASYPLQCLCFAYDVAHDAMSDAERAEVREAIATIADGLYLNTLSGHGSIYNDLRGNHTSVTMCGLGIAGLTLLGEHPEAAKWVALAETFMVDCFNEHTSGGWLESPSYGAYGVCEWLKLAEMLNNVAGRNHLDDGFFRRFADYQLYISDWEGRDLGYNGGGAGQYWNQWIFFAIARAFNDARYQWLGQCLLDDMPHHSGYGDLFWWIDPTLGARRPGGTDTGRTFHDIGVSVWRTGWGDDATILLHHCGPKGQHKEQNMNHVTLYARGQRILPDALGADTASHNVPMVDGKPQNLYYPGETTVFHSDRLCGYSVGVHPGYHRAERRVLYLRPDVIVLLDTLSLGKKGEHTVEYRLHPRGETIVNDGVATVLSGNTALRLLTVLDDGTHLPASITAIDGKEGTNLYSARHSGTGTVRAATLLLISGASASQPITVAGSDGRISVTSESRRIVLGLTPGKIAPGVETNASLWLGDTRADGRVTIMACADVAMGHSELLLRTPGGVVRGSTCVSWRDRGQERPGGQ